jgi:hypothetical protein
VIEPWSECVDRRSAPATGRMDEEEISPAGSRNCAQLEILTRMSLDLNPLAGWAKDHGWDEAGQELDETCRLSEPYREENMVPCQSLYRRGEEKSHAGGSHWVFVSPEGV